MKMNEWRKYIKVAVHLKAAFSIFLIAHILSATWAHVSGNVKMLQINRSTSTNKVPRRRRRHTGDQKKSYHNSFSLM